MRFFLIILFCFATHSAIAKSKNVLKCIEHIKQNRQDEALDCLNNEISKDSTNESLYLLRSTVYIKFNELQSAIKDLNSAILINPSNSNSYAMRGNLMIQTNQDIKAIEDISNAINLSTKGQKPFIGSLYQQRASLYQKIEKYQSALADYKISIDMIKSATEKSWGDIVLMQPNIKDNVIAEGYLGLCGCQIKLLNFTEAAKACQNGIKYANDNVLLRVNLASSYIELKNYHEAIKILKNTNSINFDKSFLVQYNMALAHLRLFKETQDVKQKDEFEKYYKYALSIADESEKLLLRKLDY